jgi:hypothetical protein
MKRVFISIIILLIAMTASAVLSQGAVPSKEVKVNIPAGFGDMQWGSKINDAKSKTIGKIVYTDEKRKIISRDSDIEYLYGFFYIDPVLEAAEIPAAGSVKPDQNSSGESGESALFYVSVRFPYLTRADVQKKIEDKYGAPTGEDVIRNQGAVIWDSEKTIIIMWVDNYENASFCKKINYIGKEIAGKINDYQKKVFNQNEIEILKKLSL